jgi:regulator of telomere elongation helicase 1
MIVHVTNLTAGSDNPRDGQTSCFRMRIGPDETRGGDGGGGGNWSAGMAAGPTLSFWCFTPGVVMTALQREGVRSIVLTSGTLSPMNSFAHELKLPFPVRLENPHVISPGQVWGGVVPVGPSGKKLNSSYRFRDTEEYKVELGNVVVNFARIIPDGLLVFFPSSGVMRACVETWKSYGTPTIWERISALKHSVVEPQDKVEFAKAFEVGLYSC